jgi:hypothetical protein
VAWDDFPRFAAQLVGWTLPAPQVEGLTARAWLEDEGAVIQVEATEPEPPGSGDMGAAGRPRDFLDVTAALIGPPADTGGAELETKEFRLAQVGAGRYQARVELARPGAYLIRLGVSEAGRALGQETLGLVVPYSPEYHEVGTDPALLNQLARLTGGGQLPEPAAAFLHNLPAADRAREFWAPLLLIAALLFPLDVALRRVMLGPADLRRAAAWLRARLPARPEAPGRERALGRLFEARDRARGRRPEAGAGPSSPREPAAEPAPPPAGKAEAEPAAPDTPVPDDALARLRQAKKRARRDR